MFDLALKSAGAQVAVVTSNDDKYPPENMIDGDSETFWISTGLYPQEFVITFQSKMNVKSLELASYNVKDITFERSSSNQPDNFEPLVERVIERSDGHQQKEEIDINGSQTQHLRVTIKSGYDHFVAIYKLVVNGVAVHG